MDLKHIILDIKDAVATVTFNRPKSLNSFSYEVFGEIKAVFEYLDQPEEDVRVIVLKSNGKAFSSGLDLLDTSER